MPPETWNKIDQTCKNATILIACVCWLIAAWYLFTGNLHTAVTIAITSVLPYLVIYEAFLSRYFRQKARTAQPDSPNN